MDQNMKIGSNALMTCSMCGHEHKKEDGTCGECGCTMKMGMDDKKMMNDKKM